MGRRAVKQRGLLSGCLNPNNRVRRASLPRAGESIVGGAVNLVGEGCGHIVWIRPEVGTNLDGECRG